MPNFTQTNQPSLEQQLQDILKAHYPDAANILTISTQFTNTLTTLALFDDNHKNHHGTLRNILLGTDRNKITAFLSMLTATDTLKLNGKTLSTNEPLAPKLLKLCLEEELRLTKEAESSVPMDESIPDERSINYLMRHKQPIPVEYLLSEDEMRRAVLQLALDKTESSDQLLRCQFVSFQKLKDETVKSAALTQTLNNIKNYPSNIVINTGGHWTQLLLTDQNNIEYIDSINSGNDTKAYYQRVVKEALLASNSFKTSNVEHYLTGKQTDNWTCGYHVLAEVAASSGIQHQLDTDLRQSPHKKRRQMLDWGINLISGTTLSQYEQELAELNTTSSNQSQKPPLPTRSLSGQQPQVKQNDVLMGGQNSQQNTSQRKQFPESHKIWLEKELFPKLGFDSTFEVSKQQFMLTPKEGYENKEKPEIVVTSNQVSANNSQSLTEQQREDLAEKMLQIFIASELNLSGDQALPPLEEIKSKQLKAASLTGNCEKLKSTIQSRLKKYGITLVTQVDEEEEIIEEVIDEEGQHIPSSSNSQSNSSF